MRTQIVVLRVTYDPDPEDEVFGGILRVPPAEWDWTDLAGDRCEVVAAGPELEVANE